MAEELLLAIREAVGEPALGGVLQDGLAIEKDNTKLGKGVGVLGEGVEEAASSGGGDDVDDDEQG